MIFPLIAAVTGLVIGVALGYLVTYRYKAQYEIARRQLANLRGENFRGEVATIPFSGAAKASDVVRESGAVNNLDEEDAAIAESDSELQQLRDRCARLEQELVQTKQGSQPAAAADIEEGPIAEAATSTSSEEWQLAQLHREQIAMQLSLDEHQLQVRNLSAELATVRSQSQGNLVQLRQILGEHEATIASLEREKSSLLDRLREFDRRTPDP